MIKEEFSSAGRNPYYAQIPERGFKKKEGSL